MSDPTTPERTCGGCTACCYVCPVHSLKKPLTTRCEHQLDDGCGIYDQRPEECRAYRCSWLMGEFDDHQRPDQTGVLFEHTTIERGDGKQTTVLMGLQFDNGPDPRQFLRHARPGTVVAIAGGMFGPQGDDLVAGYPADVRRWLNYLEDARRDGYETTTENSGTTVRIRTKVREATR